MKIPRLLLFTLALSVAFANGEETPTVEIFGGYSYAYADFNRMEQMNNKLNGWNTSFASNVNHWMGAVADFSGHDDSSKIQFPVLIGTCPPLCIPPISVNVKTYEFLFGPRFSCRTEKITPFGQVLFGVAHVTNRATLAIPVLAPPLSASVSQNGFAMATGGGLDLNLTRHFALRNQADYLLTHLFRRTQNNLRFSSGILVRF